MPERPTKLTGAQALRLLLQSPKQMALLREEPARSVAAVREALRFGSAAGGSPRFALEDVELLGKTICQGDMIMLSTSSANRPEDFDITRDTREMLVFGNGPHYCLGANLALQEMGCMLDSALDFLPEQARLVEDQVEWEQIGIMYRPVNLPVVFG